MPSAGSFNVSPLRLPLSVQRGDQHLAGGLQTAKKRRVRSCVGIVEERHPAMLLGQVPFTHGEQEQRVGTLQHRPCLFDGCRSHRERPDQGLVGPQIQNQLGRAVIAQRPSLLTAVENGGTGG